MFDWLKDAYSVNQDYVNGAASMLGILTFIYTVIKALKRRQKKILIHHKSYSLLGKKIPEEINVTFSKGDVRGDNLVIDKFLLVNRTDHILTDGAFAENIFIGSSQDTKLFFARVLDLVDGGSATIQLSDDKLILGNIKIPRRGGLALEIAHTGGLEAEMAISPIQLGEPKSYTVSHILDSTSAALVLGICGFSILWYGLFILQDHEVNIFDTLRDIVFVASALSVMFLVFAPDLKWRISEMADRFFGLLPVEKDYLEKYHRLP